jgi:hypothetical protein
MCETTVLTVHYLFHQATRERSRFDIFNEKDADGKHQRRDI